MGLFSAFHLYTSSLSQLCFPKNGILCQNLIMCLFFFRWLRNQNFGSVSCRKRCFRWLMNRFSVRLSHRKPCFLQNFVIHLPTHPFQFFYWYSSISSACQMFGKLAASWIAFGFCRLTTASTRVSSAKWELGFDLKSFNWSLRIIIILLFPRCWWTKLFLFLL